MRGVAEHKGEDMATESTASHLVAATGTFWWLTEFGVLSTGLTECDEHESQWLKAWSLNSCLNSAVSQCDSGDAHRSKILIYNMCCQVWIHPVLVPKSSVSFFLHRVLSTFCENGTPTSSKHFSPVHTPHHLQLQSGRGIFKLNCIRYISPQYHCRRSSSSRLHH
jgi:hypothetical protein